MIDSMDERFALANPVPASLLGEIRVEVARKLIDEISARPSRVTRSRRRRLLVAMLVALAVGAPVAFAAARSHLFDFALGDPAPKKVRAQLDRMLEPAYGPKEGPPQWRTRKDIIRSSERLVGQMTTSIGAVARMYAVNLRGGGACWFATGLPFSGGGCGGRALHNKATIGGIIGMTFAHMGKREPGTFAQGVTLFGPVGARGAASIRIEYKDGESDSIPVRRGWVMYEVPLAHTHWGHEPTRIDVQDASGRVLASRNDPFALHQPKQPRPEQALKPHTLLARAPLGWHGAAVELLFAKGSKGSQCIQARNTAYLQWTERWLCDPAVGRDSAITSERPAVTPQPVYVAWGTFTKFGQPSGYVYAYGWAGPSVSSVEIRYQDSTVQRLPLTRRFFLYVVPKNRWSVGKRPSYLIGRTASGRVIYRRFLYPLARCAYPAPDARCSQIIVHNG
ncbi:MAG: hypothetical protein QOH00_743 [Gaiellales bacterium]|nr:hypothetical protein [Gaiellales bacterium]